MKEIISVFGKTKTVNLAAVDWRNDPQVVKLTTSIASLEAAEREARERSEATAAVALSVTEIEDLATLVDAGREERDRLETARAARARAVLARDDARQAATRLDAARVELAATSAQAQERARVAARAAVQSTLTAMAESLIKAATLNAQLRQLADTVDAAFDSEELGRLGLTEARTALPEILLPDQRAPNGWNETDLGAFLLRLQREHGISVIEEASKASGLVVA